MLFVKLWTVCRRWSGRRRWRTRVGASASAECTPSSTALSPSWRVHAHALALFRLCPSSVLPHAAGGVVDEVTRSGVLA